MMAALLLASSGPVVSPEFNIDPPLLGPATGPQLEPAVAFDGTNHLVVWAEWRVPYRLRAARISPSREVLDPGGVELPMSCGRPVVAYGAGHFMVVCPQGLAVRVSSDGVVEDATPLSILVRGHDFDIAFNGENFLLVWTGGFGTNTSGVYSNLISPDGVVGPTTLLSGEPYHCWESTVTAVGSRFLAAWSYTDGQIVGAWVSPTGEREGSLFAMTNSGLSARYPALASDGSGYMLVYQRGLTGSTSSRGIYARYVSASGAAINYTVSTAYDQEHPDVGWSASSSVFQVVWVNRQPAASYLLGATLDTDPASVSRSSSQGGSYNFQTDANPRISATGSLIVFDRQSYDMEPDVFAAPFDGWQEIPVAVGANAEVMPAAAGGPGGYFLAWQDERQGTYGTHDDMHEIYGTRISQTGEVLDPAGLRVSQGQYTEESAPVVAGNGGGWLVAWKETASVDALTGVTLRARRLSAAGEWLDTPPLTLGQSSSLLEDLAAGSNGSNTLVVWTDSVTPLGVVLVPPSGAHTVLSAPTGAGTGLNEPSVAGTPSAYLVVWEKNGTIYGQRYSASGALLGTPMSLASGYHPVVATDGKDFLVAYTDGGSTPAAIWALGVSGSGQTLFARKQLGLGYRSASESKGAPAVAWNGYNYLVFWPASGLVSGERVPQFAGVRVSASGALLDAETFSLFPPRRQEIPTDYQWLTVAGSGDADVLAVTSLFDATTAVRAPRLVGRRVHVEPPPRPQPASLVTEEDTPKTLTLPTSDPVGAGVTFLISRAPSASTGTVQVSGDQATFTPAPDWNGTTSFEFVTRNATGTSKPATVTVTVTAVNDAPIFTMPADLVINEDSSGRSVYVTGIAPGPADELPQAWDFWWSGSTLVDVTAYYTGGTNQVRLFVKPKANRNGEALISFRVTDKMVPAMSLTQTFKVTVLPVNDAPTATAKSVTLGGSGGAITLSGKDVENTPLQYSVTRQPENGTLSGTAPYLFFTPAAGFAGTTSFDFKVSDGQLESAPATVTITVTQP